MKFPLKTTALNGEDQIRNVAAQMHAPSPLMPVKAPPKPLEQSTFKPKGQHHQKGKRRK